MSSTVRIKAPASVLAPFVAFLYTQISTPVGSDTTTSTAPTLTQTDTPAPVPTLVGDNTGDYIEIEAPAIFFESLFSLLLVNVPDSPVSEY